MSLFENFDSFSFMYDELKIPIDVTPHVEGQDEQTGKTVLKDLPTEHLEEPILNTQNPNVTFNNTDAEQMMTTDYYWESLRGDFKKGTTVKCEYGTFQVTDIGVDVAGKLYFYTLKRVAKED